MFVDLFDVKGEGQILQAPVWSFEGDPKKVNRGTAIRQLFSPQKPPDLLSLSALRSVMLLRLRL